MEDKLSNQKKTFPLAVGILVLGILIVLVLLFKSSKKQNVDNSNQQLDQRTQEVNIQKEDLPYFKLNSAGAPKKVGDNIEIFVEANSKAKAISGFDLLLAYDKSAVDFVNLESLDKNYQVFKYLPKTVDHLSLTGTKNLFNKESTVWKSVQVLKLTFKAKVKGEATFALKPAIGKEVTTMVDESSHKITPEVNEIKITIE